MEVSKDTSSFDSFDQNVLGPFPFYSFFYGINCEDGVGLQLSMKLRKVDENEYSINIIENMNFKCEYFPFYDDIHLTIP